MRVSEPQTDDREISMLNATRMRKQNGTHLMGYVFFFLSFSADLGRRMMNGGHGKGTHRPQDPNPHPNSPHRGFSSIYELVSLHNWASGQRKLAMIYGVSCGSKCGTPSNPTRFPSRTHSRSGGGAADGHHCTPESCAEWREWVKVDLLAKAQDLNNLA